MDKICILHQSGKICARNTRFIMSTIWILLCLSSTVLAQNVSINGGQTITVPGNQTSPWTMTGNLTVGNTSTGTLTISSGGAVLNNTGYLGYAASGNGTVEVTGSGSTWSNSNLLYVGYRGAGKLTISDGGTVTSTQEGYIGFYKTSSGIVTVDGSNSSWIHSGELAVGYEGTGALFINGGTVSNTVGYIGNTGSGTVMVDGAGSWVNSKELYVGYFKTGTGKLTISNGGTVSNTYAILGNQAGSLGTVMVDGAYSSWTNTDYLYVGNSGRGELSISDNAVVHVANGVTLALNSTATGILEVTSGSTLEALALKAGKGQVSVTFNDGILRAVADNSKFITGFSTGEFVINTGVLILDDQGFAVATDSSAFTGTGGLTKTGSGTFTLNGHNTYSGTTTVTSGTLKTGIANAFSSTSGVIVNAVGILDANGLDQAIASLSNNGSVIVGSNTAVGLVGSTLTVSGDYTGNNGLLTLRTVLGDSSSLTDRLVIQGNATGQTNVSIINVGGLGADTTGNGILIIQVDGISTANAFTLAAPVTAGVYEYKLSKGFGAQAQNWYLQNHLPGISAAPVLYNPNIGSYLSNQYAAATMFNHNILDRRDSTRSPDQTLWIRSHFNRMEADILGGKQEATIKTAVVQIGADIIQRDRLVAGVYAGYGYSDINNKSKQTGTKADGSVNGYQAGVYGSLLPQGNTGLYADAWAYHAWYDNELSGAAQARSTQYDSTGYAVSGEIGYGFELLSQENGRAWLLEPHAQVIYTDIDADNFYDSHGTRYTDNKASGVQNRLGVRLYGQNTPDQYGVSPFIEANWLHNDMSNRIRMDGEVASSKIGRNVGEVKVGLQGPVTESLSVWAHVGAQRGSQDFERYELQVGLGWQW